MTTDSEARATTLFGNSFGYLGLPLDPAAAASDADLVVLGIPYDLATSGRAGARHGPQGIRQASANLRWEARRWPWTFSAFERLKVVDGGDIATPTGDSGGMLRNVEQAARAVFASGKRLLALGGDHFATLPLLRAAHQTHGALALIHFDAHTDTEADDTDHYNHGAMFHHAPRENLIDAAHSIQIGIRTEYDYAQHPFSVIDAAAANDRAVADIVAAVRERVGDQPVYLDPAFAPGTGTPVVGGLSTDRALKILRGLQGLNLVAMDIMEVAPCYDHAEITSLAAATLGLEFIYLVASGADR
jgi:agmatinase